MKSSPANRVAILGGGITALSLAWHLQRQAPQLKITLYESSDEVGGYIKTDTINGALFEWGPHTIRLASPHKEVCLELFEQLGLSHQIYIPKKVSKRWLCYEGKLHQMPSHPFDLLKPTFFKTLLIPLLREPFKNRRLHKEDCSIYSFFTDRFGSEFFRFFIDPLVTGIYGGNAKDLSMQACFPQIYQNRSSKSLLLSLMKQKKKSPSLMMTFSEGLKCLPKALFEKLDIEFALQQQVTQLHLGSQLSVSTSKETREFDSVFSCLPAHQLARILSNDFELTHALEDFTSISYKIIHFGFPHSLHLPKGFGFLSPSWSTKTLQGVIYDSCITPIHNSKVHPFRLTTLLSEKSPLFTLSEDFLIPAVLKELEFYFKQPLKPNYEKLYFFPHAITQYQVGHVNKIEKLQKIFSKRSNQFFFGGRSFFGGSIPACIMSGKKMADDFLSQKTQTV